MAAEKKLSDAEWLEKVRTATGLPSLPIGKVRTEDEILRVLDLSEQRLTSLLDIGQLTSLTKLHLYNNLLASLPESIGQLTKLTKLYLYNNLLASLPGSIGQLKRLIKLDLGQNQLASLPQSFGQLMSLTGLSLRNNQLASLPESIGKLTSLTKLDLGQNQLASLPESIGKLTKLTNLDTSIPVRGVTALACVALFFWYVIGVISACSIKGGSGPVSEDEKGDKDGRGDEEDRGKEGTWVEVQDVRIPEVAGEAGHTMV